MTDESKPQFVDLTEVYEQAAHRYGCRNVSARSVKALIATWIYKPQTPKVSRMIEECHKLLELYERQAR